MAGRRPTPCGPSNAAALPACCPTRTSSSRTTASLRRVEGILRRWSYEGETVLPDDPAPYYRVSVRCGFPTPEAFREALAGWRKAIREVYLKVFEPPGGAQQEREPLSSPVPAGSQPRQNRSAT